MKYQYMVDLNIVSASYILNIQIHPPASFRGLHTVPPFYTSFKQPQQQNM